MSDFHIVVIFNDYYTLIMVAVFDETDAEQKQKQTVSQHSYILCYVLLFYFWHSSNVNRCAILIE